jgi:hypothetical protein
MKGKMELLTNFIFLKSNGRHIVERISKSMQFFFLDNC